jgi:hypothetical protein
MPFELQQLPQITLHVLWFDGPQVPSVVFPPHHEGIPTGALGMVQFPD